MTERKLTTVKDRLESIREKFAVLRANTDSPLHARMLELNRLIDEMRDLYALWSKAMLN